MEMRTWFKETKATSIMAHALHVLRVDDSLASAAALFLAERISGAPVVDATGKCVGVLSVTDLAGAEGRVKVERERNAAEDPFHSGLVLPMKIYEERLAEFESRTAPASAQPVSRFMSRHLLSVHEDATLEEVVLKMLVAHVHRVLVFDDDDRLKGLISTTDVLMALVEQAK